MECSIIGHMMNGQTKLATFRSGVWHAENSTLIVAGWLHELCICCYIMALLFHVYLLLHSFAAVCTLLFGLSVLDV